MSVGFFSANTTFKIDGAVQYTSVSTGTQFQEGSTSFAIFQVYATAAATITIDGKVVAVMTADRTVQLYAGPSQIVAISSNSGTVTMTGVNFTNTP